MKKNALQIAIFTLLVVSVLLNIYQHIIIEQSRQVAKQPPYKKLGTQQREVSAELRATKQIREEARETAMTEPTLARDSRVSIPKSALRYMQYYGITPDGKLTENFRDISGASDTELKTLQKEVTTAYAKLRTAREDASVIVTATDKEAQVHVFSYADAAAGIQQGLFAAIDKEISKEVVEIFKYTLQNELQRAFGSAGALESDFFITPSQTASGLRVYKVTEASKPIGAAEYTSRVVNTYKYEDFVKRVPKADALVQLK